MANQFSGFKAEDMLLAISNRVKNTVSKFEYVDSKGVKRCKKCNEKTICKYPLRLKTGKEVMVWARCVCDCISLAEEEGQLARQASLIQINQNKAFEGFGRKYKKCTFATDDKKNMAFTKIMHAYVKNFDKYYADGLGLILYGSTGTGKTYAAAVMVNEILRKENPKTDKLYSCFITKCETIKQNILARHNDAEVFGKLASVDLLVLDDFGTQNDTNFMMELMQKIVDARYNNCKPTIITTNIDLTTKRNEGNQTQILAYQRIQSRLCEMCKIVKCGGKDRRVASK